MVLVGCDQYMGPRNSENPSKHDSHPASTLVEIDGRLELGHLSKSFKADPPSQSGKILETRHQILGDSKTPKS